MFDFRYHALSLAAVFIALVVGLLLGVAIGDKELVSSAKNDLRNSLRRDVIKANGERDTARTELREQEQFVDRSYPILTGGELRGRRIGLVMLGASDDAPKLVGDALEPTGGELQVVTVVRSSVDTAKIAARARGTRYERLARDDKLLDDFGNRIGVQMVEGGELIGKVRKELLRPVSGKFDGLDGVVVVRSADEPEDEQAADRLKTLHAGIADGLVSTGVTVVGIETRKRKPSQVSWYRGHEMSSVDNVDEDAGRAALVFVLAGADGAFGRKGGVPLLPPVVGR
ncbi:MAG: copper transporter [Actinomycetota bacterium]|nr:copper transporter [Actinomycetota bacterium]